MDAGLKTSRRKFLAAASTAAGSFIAGGNSYRGLAQVRPHAPACAHAGEPTPRETAGPYFKPDSPQRSLLAEPGERGTALHLSGLVITTSCQPIAQALLDF